MKQAFWFHEWQREVWVNTFVPVLRSSREDIVNDIGRELAWHPMLQFPSDNSTAPTRYDERFKELFECS